MAITVKLYGDLRKRVKQEGFERGLPSTLTIKNNKFNTIFDILEKFKIKQSEISHIFVNGKYCGPGKTLGEGDRIGLFPKRMALMFVEIVKNNTISVKIKLYANLRKYGPPEAFLELPEGSTVNTIIQKANIPKEEQNLKILINGRPHQNQTTVLNDGDIVAIFPPIGGG
ncbi:MAG: MoaD/ThiS family protein [Candidatus Hodarchaeota archaeon]